MTSNWAAVKRARRYREIGKRIRLARQERGLTLEQTAERCSLQASYLSQLECGYYCPSVHMVDRLAKGLGVTIASILEGAL